MNKSLTLIGIVIFSSILISCNGLQEFKEIEYFEERGLPFIKPTGYDFQDKMSGKLTPLKPADGDFFAIENDFLFQQRDGKKDVIKIVGSGKGIGGFPSTDYKLENNTVVSVIDDLGGWLIEGPKGTLIITGIQKKVSEQVNSDARKNSISSTVSRANGSSIEKLNGTNVLKSLYPNKALDSEGRIMRVVTRNEEGYNQESGQVRKEPRQLELRTELYKEFYYQVNSIQKATFVLASHKVDDFDHEVENGHACSVELEIATFTLENNGWKLEKFVENWEGDDEWGGWGNWGTPPDIKMKTYKGTRCIVTEDCFFNMGDGECTTRYYDIGSLKLIHTERD